MRVAASTGSTSKQMAATARWANETSRVDAHADRPAGRRAPHDLAAQHAVAQVERALVVDELAVADVEGLVVDEQAHDLAVRDVDERLAGLGVAVAGLGVGQRPRLVEAVEVGPRRAVGLALVEVAAQPDVAVGEREDGLGLRELVEAQLALADDPGVDLEDVVVAHAAPSSPSSSERS